MPSFSPAWTHVVSPCLHSGLLPAGALEAPDDLQDTCLVVLLSTTIPDRNLFPPFLMALDLVDSEPVG